MITSTSDHPLSKLPVELREKVVQDVDEFPMSLEKAKDLRKELMEERRGVVVGQTEHFEELVFSLCEH